MYNNVEADDIDTTTAFGEITYDEIEFSMDYPFEFDGIQYYYAHYIYDGVNILADKPEDVFNTVDQEQKLPMKNSKKTMERNYPI